jgi:hypothetical protein
VLHGSHGRETGPLLQENMCTVFDVDIYKPNVSLAKVVKDLLKLHKDLTKEGHTVIVGESGYKLSLFDRGWCQHH